jgi:hypothetical protein
MSRSGRVSIRRLGEAQSQELDCQVISFGTLEKDLPHHPAGLIVDPHMVFEHVFYNTDNMDTLAHLQQCYKIKVTIIADGVAMTLFDSKIPKFFSCSHGHKVVKMDGSFLDSIGSYQEWDDLGTGYRL